MIVLSYLIVLMSLVAPFLAAKVLGKNFLEQDSVLFIALTLQAVLGFISSIYVYGYEHRKRTTVLLGYSVFFLSTGLCYLVGKTLWLILFWELSTVNAFLLYQGGKWTPNSIKSFIALVVAGGVGAFCFTYWIYSPKSEFGNMFLVAGLLVKAVFFWFSFLASRSTFRFSCSCISCLFRNSCKSSLDSFSSTRSTLVRKYDLH